ncbi:hypothetical protein A5320_05495 [Rheinheimera sp. SA_1]|uniref:hypothetical protein n=1 Tax=Rheinheimera sp. SA_1 TaxID=1827365 RepID=UPI0007FDEDB3|nr:hypothetical protein [Rheinheimera sp. SA_1]OBP16825.1 hypothetical protein A5320_05495 [Rheinheimera sp. SA_1]
MKVYEIGYLFSQIGGRYPGISIPEEDVAEYLRLIEQLVGHQEYHKLTENQIRRDGGEYHVTLLTPQEYGRSSYEDVEKYIGKEISLNYLGLGKVKKGRDEVYFVVIESPQGDLIRENLGFTERDFHITLGFTSRDIFGVRKDVSTLING